jgi:hypothetical protein
MRPMRLHIAGKVEDDVQRCVVCGEVLFDANSTKVEPGMRVAEAITGESEGRHLESMTPEDSLPLGIYACKPARI